MDLRLEKMEKIIEAGKRDVSHALESIARECNIRKDMIVKPSAIDYRITDNTVYPTINNTAYKLTSHSERQMFERVGVPIPFAKRLMALGEEDLLKNNLKRLTNRVLDGGVLVREVDGTIKGWLSTAYKRMDSAPVFESFIKKVIDYGMVPYQGRVTDYRYQIRFIRPKVFTPIDGEYVIFGLGLNTGDYGSSALEMFLLIIRLVCLNLHEGYDLFRRIHLGSRIEMEDKEDIIELSQQTCELDGKTVASAIGDCVDAYEKHIDFMENKIQESAGKEVNTTALYANLKKKGFKKEVVENIRNLYESNLMPIEVLPQEKNLWRFSNAISYVSKVVDDADQKTDLERTAMEVLLN